MRTILLFLAFGVAAFGQRHPAPTEVDAEKPEGKLLQQIMQEADAAKKNALMEQFANEFAKAPETPWVLETVQTYYVKANQPDRVIAAADKLLAVDPDDPESALQALKAAETKKDLALIKKYSEAAAKNAKKVKEPGEAEYAKGVGQYADYALFRAAVESRDPKVTIDMAEALVQRSPDGEYGMKAQDPLFLAYRQAGATDKAIALAEKVLEKQQTNEDMLLVVADSYVQKKKDPEKVHAYSAKIVEIMGAKPKPEGMADADWNNRKNTITGVAYYMSGRVYSEGNKNQQADQQLRKALPLVEANPEMKAEVLFRLGLANYNMAKGSPERAQDAATFFRQCSAIKSPYQPTAATNVKKIMTEYRGIK
jgi:tetratricopeptide (TPR) repeat protein